MIFPSKISLRWLKTGWFEVIYSTMVISNQKKSQEVQTGRSFSPWIGWDPFYKSIILKPRLVDFGFSQSGPLTTNFINGVTWVAPINGGKNVQLCFFHPEINPPCGKYFNLHVHQNHKTSWRQTLSSMPKVETATKWARKSLGDWRFLKS